MTEPVFITGDWGTSRLRLSLCDKDGRVLERLEGPGAAQAGAQSGAILTDLTAPWDAAHGKLPAIFSGMVGSTIGWREVPYVPCPASPDVLANGALRFKDQRRTITIMPGMSCRNRCDVADVMRGEETQILGALRLRPALAEGSHLLCLPGTHAKWVLVENGCVMQFHTALSGELFELLRHHSVLARDSGPVDVAHDGFQKGLALAYGQREAGLLHLLFSTRSRQLFGEINKVEAASYLSGLVVGSDVASGVRMYEPKGPVTLICAPALAALYQAALAAQGFGVQAIDGDDAALAGLAAIHDLFYGACNV